LTYDSTGRFLFISTIGIDGLLAFETDPNSGALFSRGAFRTRSGADHLAVVVGPEPVVATVRGVFVSDKGPQLSNGNPGISDGMIHQFEMDPTTGQLQTSALAIPVGNDPGETLVHPRGSLLFTLDIPAASLYSLGVDSKGLIDTSQSSALSTPIDPRTMALNPLGTVLYLATGGAQASPSVYAYGINQETGLLSLLGSKELSLTPSTLLPDPTGRWLVAADISSGLLATIPLLDNGIPNVAGAISTLTVIGGPSAMMFAPNGQDIFVAFRDTHMIRGYRLASPSGTLSINSGSDGVGFEIGTGPLSEPFDIVHHPFETWLFATLEGTGDVIQSDYSKATSSATMAGISLGDLEISPLGRFIFTVDMDDRSISGLRIGADGIPVLQTSAPHVLDNPAVVRASISWD
jgi:6-phosphogluconolactonase (cycloisomerase 2 family)